QQETSAAVRTKVQKARGIQNKRFKGLNIFTNSEMQNRDIKKFCKIKPPAQRLLKQAVGAYNLSARTYFRLIKVSQTIADLAQEGSIGPAHVAEALQYRVRIQE
ncbi:MAG: Mg chelatase, subunit ChlI, magnesium chelatase family protein, partial [Candidatus Curtissbacteria bacterium GW2011_GWC1_44_33]